MEILKAAYTNIYPCYSLISKAKKVCYAKEKSIPVTESFVEINLQAFLNNTAFHLCKYLEEVLENYTKEERQQL